MRALLLIASMLLIAGIWSPAGASPNIGTELPPDPLSVNDAGGWKWASSAWTSSGAAYEKVTLDVNGLTADQCAVIRNRCHDDYVADLDNTVLLYRWAYVVWKSAKPTTSFAERHRMRYAVMMVLQAAHPPYTYELARMRFLYDSDFADNRNLCSLGNRLLACSPDDYDVEKCMVADLGDAYLHGNSALDQEALTALGARIMAHGPDRAGAHIDMGYIDYVLWQADKRDTGHLDAAINELNT